MVCLGCWVCFGFVPKRVCLGCWVGVGSVWKMLDFEAFYREIYFFWNMKKICELCVSVCEKTSCVCTNCAILQGWVVRCLDQSQFSSLLRLFRLDHVVIAGPSGVGVIRPLPHSVRVLRLNHSSVALVWM